ncbi:hypothetical protein [Micromonospora sp. CPCC 206061]|uniref:hypothetical protein n=1 Tax=Micromonospora sp. CPCC 206061 TaxID=3122410 RepID=UPI002FF12285
MGGALAIRSRQRRACGDTRWHVLTVYKPLEGQRYIPMLLDRMERDELVTDHLATHVLPLDSVFTP